MSKRLPDWEERLGAYLMEVRERAHAFGSHDCALHGARAVEAITGADHGAPFRGRYTTALGAKRALKRFGAGSIEATFDAHLASIPPSFAGRGDLVMADTPTGPAIGVCIGGDGMFVGREGEHDGLVRLPRSTWTRAWRVG